MTDYYEEEDTGPFCPHWRQPWGCDAECSCGHVCSDHYDKCAYCKCEKFEDV